MKIQKITNNCYISLVFWKKSRKNVAYINYFCYICNEKQTKL